MSWLGRRVFSVITAAALLCAAPAWGQPAEDPTRTAARALGNSGVEAYQAGDYVTATDHLEKAYGILRVPSLGLWSARALVKNGKWVEAVDRYLEVASLQVPQGDYAVQKQAQADAEADLAALRPKIPIVAVKTEGAPLAETQISIDGRAVPSALAGEGRLVNPGQHVVEGRYAGQPVRVEVTLVEAQHETVVLRFNAAAPPSTVAAAPLPAAEPRDAGVDGGASDGKTQRTFGWVAVGAGAVGIGVGTVFGVLALGKKSQLDDNPACVDDRCAPSQTDSVDAYNMRRAVSSVGFIAGGVLAGVGVVLLATAPSQKRTAELFVSPNSAGVRGTF